MHTSPELTKNHFLCAFPPDEPRPFPLAMVVRSNTHQGLICRYPAGLVIPLDSEGCADVKSQVETALLILTYAFMGPTPSRAVVERITSLDKGFPK